MSVDIAWDTITTGPDGDALSEKVRAFIHTKFQQITLPRFINSVHVHSFEFGSVCPEIEIKDISDPLPEFYEDDESSNDDDDGHNAEQHDRLHDGTGDDLGEHTTYHAHRPPGSEARTSISESRVLTTQAAKNGSVKDATHFGQSHLEARLNPAFERLSSIETQGHVFPRSGTPGIPGGTSNLGYFHLPIGGLSGAQTPLAAVASGTPFSPGPWLSEHQMQRHNEGTARLASESLYRPRTSDSIPSPELGSPFDPSSPETRPVGFSAAEKVSDDLTLESLSLSPTLKEVATNPSDLQVVAHVKYDGDVQMTLTAEVLLDYPMPSFVNIPLKLSVTGMKFDGVAILAYIRKRMHFAFLDPDDAQTLAGDQMSNSGQAHAKSTFGSLLQEVQIESEIGQQASGKQVLKNVGKVEKFVLEQVKRIFEEEFVFPSFWTFLV